MAGRFQIWYRAQPPAIRLLLTINVAAYLAWNLLLVHFQVTREFVWAHLALDPALPELLFQPWRVLTYAFLHLGVGFGGLLHILFNMAWLVWIGRDFEQMQGSARLFALYILGALGGALLTVLLHGVLPNVPYFAGLVHGASGGVLGVMAGVALLYPWQEIMLLFIGSVRLIWVVVGFLALDILFLSAGGTSVSAHLGGVLTGFGFARAQQAGWDLSAWARPLFAPQRSPARAPAVSRPVQAVVRKPSVLRKVVLEKEEDPAPDPAEQVDRILDKISAGGYDSLTAEEKRILDEASRR